MRAFEMLGLPEDATVAQVKAAYRAKSLAVHPDHGGSPAAFHALHLAYKAALERAQAPVLCPKCRGLGVKITVSGWTSSKMTCVNCAGKGLVERKEATPKSA